MEDLDYAAVPEPRAPATVLEVEEDDISRSLDEKHRNSLIRQHHEQACWQMRQHAPESPRAVELAALR
jgi:hypothetical protein